jgi:hypothetical protein
VSITSNNSTFDKAVVEAAAGEELTVKFVNNGADIMAFPEERFRREVRWLRISMVMQAAMNAGVTTSVTNGRSPARAIAGPVCPPSRSARLRGCRDLCCLS